MSFFDSGKINRAVSVLKSGGIIAYPTETLYGLGADISNKEAVNKVFLSKKREYNKPVSVAVADFKSIYKLTKIDSRQKEIIKKFLPGPYTFLLKSNRVVLDIVTAGSDVIGIRYPDHRLACQIIEKLGKPITSTSANLSGNDPASNYHQIDVEADYIVKGKCKYKTGSTIIDLINNRIIRKGAGLEEVEKYFVD
jgi:L-threonylcarbamoyladenylate synthase